MAAGNLFEQPITVRLQALIESVRAGKLLLPEFQRPFVWSDEQRLLLFDSIVTGLPIGSLLLWRTTLNVVIKTKLEGFDLPVAADEKPRSYVLDGQQRVFTLYASLAVEQQTPDPDGERRRWPIFLDLEADLASGVVGGESRFKLARRDRPPPETWLPLSVILHPKSLLAYQARLYTDGKDKLAERAEEVANIFKDYPISLVPIVTDNLRLATLSFQRVNSQGSSMSESHMLRALTYEQDFDLTQRFEEFVATLPWGSLDHQVLVNTIKALSGLSVYGADVSNVIPQLKEDKGKSSILDRMESGVRVAIEFLTAYVNIRSEAALPYSYQLVALAYAAAHGDNLVENHESLTQWFWATTYTGYFAGMTAGQLRQAFEHVRKVCDGADPLPAEMVKRCSPLAHYRWPSARSLAFMHLLARQALVDEHGVKIDGMQLLARGGAASSPLYLKQPASKPENRILVAPESAAAVRHALMHPLHLLSADSDLRKAHILPPLGHPALMSIQATLKWRRTQLRKMEADFIHSLGLTLSGDNEEANATD